MERCANTEALNREEQRAEKAEKILEHEQNDLYLNIKPYILGINNTMKFFAADSVMDKQAILEYVKETLDELLEIR